MANARSAGTCRRKVPESEVAMPDCLPRIVTETFARGFSFSSTTLPDTNAVFFWAQRDVEAARKKINNRKLQTVKKEKLPEAYVFSHINFRMQRNKKGR